MHSFKLVYHPPLSLSNAHKLRGRHNSVYEVKAATAMSANDATAATARLGHSARPAVCWLRGTSRIATGVGHAAWHKGDSAPVSGSKSSTTWGAWAEGGGQA